MYDPISVETALVSSGGDLLIQLTDGSIINAGRVRGMPGPKGDQGEQGIRGAHGKDGVDGTNGAKWHTGVGAPEIGLGENGDLYMDVAAMVLPIYQKVDGDWLFLANLKGGGTGGGVGATGGGAAGDGSAVIIKPGPTPPTNDNDGNPVDIGDLWWDSTTGLIYINTINGWIPISDHPPIIVSPDPPTFTNNSDPNDPNKRYPIREGDSWFDSDQAALYVAVKNVDDDLVWVISTPADRSILQEEIPIGGFVFPAVTQDGDTVFNDTTGLWYFYNGPKKQWIDLPPGERELSYPGILREADPAIDETYEGEADAADGDVYLNSSDHETGTRLVVRKVDRKGFSWVDIIQGIAEGDGIALVQTNYDNGPDNPQTQRVDYLIVTSIVENIDSFSIEVDYEQQNFDHLPLFGEEVSVRFLAQVSSPAVCVTFQEDTPEPKCVGHLWFDSSEDDYTLYLYDGNEWVPAAPPVSLEGIEQSISGLTFAVDELKTITTGQGQAIADAQSTLYGVATALQAIDEDQTRQDNQIVELEEEIESLAPSTDRGSWTFSDTMPLASGEYTMGASVTSGYCIDQYERCIQAAPGYPSNIDPVAQSECTRIAAECETAKENGELYMPDYSHAVLLHFHKLDSDGKEHSFADWTVGKYVDLFDREDEDYALFEITEAPTQDGDVYTIGVQALQHQGEAGGLVRVKVFEMASADPTEYVRRTGDTMTGKLAINTSLNSGGLWVYAPQGEAGDGQVDATQLVRVANSRNQYVFYVEESGAIAGKQGMVPTDARHLVPKQYLDDAIAAALNNVLSPGPAQLAWEYRQPASGKGPADGTFWKDSNHFRISMKTWNGVNLASSYPPAKNEWWCPGGEKYGARYLMSVWKKSTDGWLFYEHIECDKTRWVLTTDGVTHFQFRRSWEAYNKTFDTGEIYYITVGGFF